jgi:AcrR family transcriptional regulator
MEFHGLEQYSSFVETVRNEPRTRLAQARAETTRLAIVDAAAELFTAHGYVRTTIEQIATRAGVAVQTIYNSIGSKRTVLSQVLDASTSGPDAPTPVPELGARIKAEADPVRIVLILAGWFTEMNARTASVFSVMREAAGVDPDVTALQAERARERLAEYSQAAKEIAKRGALRRGLAPDGAGAFMWALGNPDVYRFLSNDLGWTPRRYRAWMERSLRSGLLRRMDGS